MKAKIEIEVDDEKEFPRILRELADKTEEDRMYETMKIYDPEGKEIGVVKVSV